jgi:hypothetical protein
VGEVPRAGGFVPLLLEGMKAQRTTSKKSGGTSPHETKPCPEDTVWKTAVPPRIVGKNHARAGEWRPGEPAHRGYEKAVEDWWWL